MIFGDIFGKSLCEEVESEAFVQVNIEPHVDEGDDKQSLASIGQEGSDHHRLVSLLPIDK